MSEAEFSWIAAEHTYLSCITGHQQLRAQHGISARAAMACHSTREDFSMTRAIMILATAALASTLAIGAANAHGGGGGGGHGGFGGGHAGFGGGAHFGGMGHGGGFGGSARFGGEHLGFADHAGGFRQHAFHRYGGTGYGSYGAYPDCYDWYELHPGRQFPLSCS
jgi:hypothetical protein